MFLSLSIMFRKQLVLPSHNIFRHDSVIIGTLSVFGLIQASLARFITQHASLHFNEDWLVCSKDAEVN